MRDVVTSPALPLAKRVEQTLVLFLCVTGTRCVFRSLPRMCSSTGQGLNDFEPGHLIPSGIWTLADIMDRGKSSNTCPYFTIRRMVACQSFKKVPSAEIPISDAVRRRHYLLVPLPVRPKSGRTSLERAFKGCDRSIR